MCSSDLFPSHDTQSDNKKPRTGRRRPKTRTKRNQPKLTLGFPTRLSVTLHYEDLIAINPSAPKASYAFRGNSCYDPDYTSTGHQPRYYDQYSAIYQKYKVLKSTCTIEMLNYSGSSGLIFALVPNTDIITFTSWEVAAELPLAKISKILPVASRYPFVVSGSRTTESVCGLLPYQINDEDYSALVTNSPVSVWYWNVCMESIDATTNVEANFRVKIEYVVDFYERAVIGAS